MRRLSCKRVEPRLAEYQLGELPEVERAAINVHLAVCDDCREVAEIWAGLPTAVREAELPALPPLVERRLLAGGRPPARREIAIELTARRLAIAATLAAAVVALVLGVAFGPDATGAAPEIGGIAVAAPAAGIAEVDRAVSLAPALLAGPGVEVAGDCRVWSGPESVVRLERVTADEIRLRLERGFALFEIGPLEPEQRVIVATPGGEVEARGTIFSVEVAPSGHETVRVTEGQVELRGRPGDAAFEVVGAGQQSARGAAPVPAAEQALDSDLALLLGVPMSKPATTGGGASSVARPRTAPSSLDALVKQVQTLRRARRYREAAAGYEQIIERHPGTRTAANALVGLGQLELSALGRPRDARAHFETYLSTEPAGMLAEEARAGLVRSLDRLARRGELISAATEYLERHPRGGSAAEMLRRRGDARRLTGSCRQAVSDYRRVLTGWAGSREAARAVSGLDACGVTP